MNAVYLSAYIQPLLKQYSVTVQGQFSLQGLALIVQAIPQDNRPYIGGSKTNSVLELAFGYNGMQRLTGMNQGGAPGIDGQNREMPDRPQMQDNEGLMRDGSIPEGAAPYGVTPGIPPDGNGEPGQIPNLGKEAAQGGGMGGGMFGTGQAGPFRLFQTELSGQISWLLPFAAFACIGLLAGVRRRKSFTAKQNETLFWLAWLLPGMAFFSVAGFFHQYYLIMLAPPIAALAGAGWTELWDQYRDKEGWKMWLLPLALLVTTVFELYILQPYQEQIGMGWSIGIGAAGIGLALILVLVRNKEKLASIAAAAGMLALLAAPLYWAAAPIIYGGNSMLPQAGPTQQGSGSRQGMAMGMNSGADTKLIEYVTKNTTNEKYFFITTDASTAESYIISTGKAVVAMGGFSGSDPALTVEKLEQMVKDKEVKYFLIPSGSGIGDRGGAGGGSTEVLNWIRTHSTEVPQTEWKSSTGGDGSMGKGEAKTLYQINQ